MKYHSICVYTFTVLFSYCCPFVMMIVYCSTVYEMASSFVLGKERFYSIWLEFQSQTPLLSSFPSLATLLCHRPPPAATVVLTADASIRYRRTAHFIFLPTHPARALQLPPFRAVPPTPQSPYPIPNTHAPASRLPPPTRVAATATAVPLLPRRLTISDPLAGESPWRGWRS
jgi:hypothetical protein